MENINLKNVNAVHHEPPKSNHIKSTWSGFKEFAASSNLHGLKYFSENISSMEKLFWAVTFIGSIALCSLNIKAMLYKWETSPVIVSINDEKIPVWKVPFPAVTICPQLKCKQSVYNYTKVFDSLYHNHNQLDESKKNEFDDISTVCGRVASYSNRNITDASLVEHILSVAPKIKDVFKECIWQENTYKCDKLFKEVLTKEGLCFTFNTQHVDDMFRTDSIQQDFIYLNKSTTTKDRSIANGYTDENFTQTYPRMGRQNGAEPDLKVTLMEPLSEARRICNIMYKGFKVYMHHPSDMPQSNLYYYAVLPTGLTALATKFSMVSTSETLKTYSTKIRQCYFPSERRLQYFKVYTQSNCELECLSKYTYKMCKCVWFHMPHDNSSQICTNRNFKCTINAIEHLSRDVRPDTDKTESKGCDCLPACNSLTYDAEVLRTAFDYNTNLVIKSRPSATQFESIFKKFSENIINSYEYSRLEVFFKESRFTSLQRSEVFGAADFIASCGGLLGLFMGFSFLSIVEIIYFLTRRICRCKSNKINSSSTNKTECSA